MIGVLVLVCLCSLFLGKISALVATLAVALLAAMPRRMPPMPVLAPGRAGTGAFSPLLSPGRVPRDLLGAAYWAEPSSAHRLDSGAVSGTPRGRERQAAADSERS